MFPRHPRPNILRIVVRALQGVFPRTFRDLTPIASIIGDYSVIAVRRESPYTHLDQVKAAIARDPRAVAIGGGSVSGGTDHIVAAMLYRGLGFEPRSVKYIPYDAGGKAMAGLLSGEVQILSSGYGEVIDLAQQEWVRIICIAARERIPGAPDLPTCAEQGAENTVFVNWRGFFATPGIPADLLASYRAALKEMMGTPAWAAVRERYGWVDLYLAGDAFVEMLHEQERQLSTTMKQLGLL